MKFTKFSAFFLIIILFLGLSNVHFSASGNINMDVITPRLVEKFKDSGQDEVFNLIVQFKEEITENDLTLLDLLDFRVEEKFHIIPGVHVYGKKDAILALSNYDRTYWIETNH